MNATNAFHNKIIVIMVSFDETFIIYKMQYFMDWVTILNILYYAIIATEKPLFGNYNKSIFSLWCFLYPLDVCSTIRLFLRWGNDVGDRNGITIGKGFQLIFRPPIIYRLYNIFGRADA